MLSGTSFHCAIAANMDEDVDAKSPVKRIKIQFLFVTKVDPYRIT